MYMHFILERLYILILQTRIRKIYDYDTNMIV